MRKLITLALCAVMLASLFAVSSSAAGSILFQDDFSDLFTDPNKWILEGNLFFGDDMSDPSNPCVSAYADGVVNQMEFRPEFTNSGAKSFTNCVMSVDVRLRDFDRDGDHTAQLWWKERFMHVPEGEELPEGFEEGPAYSYGVNFDDEYLYLNRSDTDGNLVEVPVPGIAEKDDWFNLGWRITAGKIDLYFEGEKIGELVDEGLTAEYPSPFLLWNGNCFLSYDNLIVATADYDLFNEGTVDTTVGTDAPVDSTEGTDAPVDNTDAPADNTDAPVDNTDAPADNTDAPADNTNAPVDDPADTVGTTGTQQPSTSTGDAMVVVAIAMIVALGTAVIVKKVQAE